MQFVYLSSVSLSCRGSVNAIGCETGCRWIFRVFSWTEVLGTYVRPPIRGWRLLSHHLGTLEENSVRLTARVGAHRVGVRACARVNVEAVDVRSRTGRVLRCPRVGNRRCVRDIRIWREVTQRVGDRSRARLDAPVVQHGPPVGRRLGSGGIVVGVRQRLPKRVEASDPRRAARRRRRRLLGGGLSGAAPHLCSFLSVAVGTARAALPAEGASANVSPSQKAVCSGRRAVESRRQAKNFGAKLSGST